MKAQTQIWSYRLSILVIGILLWPYRGVAQFGQSDGLQIHDSAGSNPATLANTYVGGPTVGGEIPNLTFDRVRLLAPALRN